MSFAVPAKRKRNEEEDAPTFVPPRSRVSQAPEQEEAEEAEEAEEYDERRIAMERLENDDQEVQEFDVVQLRKLLASFEKKFNKNQEMRVKFADDPMKFMDSEMELHQEIQQMNIIATVPSLYSIMIKGGHVATLVSLVGHENSDIVVAVIDLLQEMTDTDALEDNSESAAQLIEELVKNDFLPQLVPTLERLESTGEDEEGVHHLLGIVENVCELDEQMVETLFHKTPLVDWLLKTVKRKEFSANKLYSSELLAVLLQTSEKNREAFGAKGSIEVLLLSLSHYKKRDPETREDLELLENLFDSLCSVLMCEANKGLFVDLEGTELMILMLQQKSIARFGAMKTLNYALMGKAGAAACEVFVEKLGLKSLFPAFMKTPTYKDKALKPSTDGIEEHIMSVIVSLLENLAQESRNRVLGKFIEDDFAKVTRLVELHHEYQAAVRKCDKRLAREREELLAAGEEVDEDVENEQYLARLDAGLFTLQLIDYTCALIVEACGEDMQAFVAKLLKMRGGSLDDITAILGEYADNVDEGKAARLRELVAKCL